MDDPNYTITTEPASVSDDMISSVKEDLQNHGYSMVYVNFKEENHLLRHARHDLLKSLSDNHPWIDDIYFDLQNDKQAVEITNGIGRVDILPKSCLKIHCLSSITTVFSRLLSSSNILNTFDVPQLLPSNQHQSYRGITIKHKPLIAGLFTLTKQNVTKDRIEIPPGTLILYRDSDDICDLFPQNKTKTTWLGLRIGYVSAENDIYDSVLRANLFFSGRFGIHFNRSAILSEDMIYDDRRLFVVMKPQLTKYFIGPNVSTNIELINFKFPQRRQLLFSNGILQYVVGDNIQSNELVKKMGRHNEDEKLCTIESVHNKSKKILDNITSSTRRNDKKIQSSDNSITSARRNDQKVQNR